MKNLIYWWAVLMGLECYAETMSSDEDRDDVYLMMLISAVPVLAILLLVVLAAIDFCRG